MRVLSFRYIRVVYMGELQKPFRLFRVIVIVAAFNIIAFYLCCSGKTETIGI
jgi:hypothetical protein